MKAFRISKNIFKIIVILTSFFYLISIKLSIIPVGAIIGALLLYSWSERQELKEKIKPKQF